jgi:hypothetical protein
MVAPEIFCPVLYFPLWLSTYKGRGDVLSALDRGEKELGAAVLLAISREFGKSVDWLLTGKTHIGSKEKGNQRFGGT